MLAPHQSKHQVTSSLGCKNNIAVRHKTDPVSLEIEGSVLFIETSRETFLNAHYMSSFHSETEAIIRQFMINKKANKENLLEDVETKVREAK